MKLLDKINSIEDLKKIPVEKLKYLTQEIRDVIINRVDKIGGHLGSNLAVVELITALHYVFDSPKDKFVFDVSHQCYTHKILTGRKDFFIKEEFLDKISGYTNPNESEHDLFITGHTSTSISQACGIAKARDLKNEDYNVLAIIGDGSLGGGEAFEGLNNAYELKSNLIIILNDNEMSISNNYGGLYSNLESLRNTKGKCENNFFKSLGFQYIYLDEGNDVTKLVELFKKIKDNKSPIVVHIHTKKGCGLKIAEENKEEFHWCKKHGTTWKFLKEKIEENYPIVVNKFLRDEFEKNKDFVIVSPATPTLTFISKEFRKILRHHYVDVGICEQHSISFLSGLLKGNIKAILEIDSSFMQRAYDQILQDICLNNIPAIILVYGGNISQSEGTHQRVFDIPILSNIPNLIYLAPTNKEELLGMLTFAIRQNKYPLAIRIPTGKIMETGEKDNTNYYEINKFKVIQKGENIAIIGVGNFFEKASKVCEILRKKYHINATLINPCFISNVDKDLLEKLKGNHKFIVVLEDGIKEGGFGYKVCNFFANSFVKVKCYGADKEFISRRKLEESYNKYRLKESMIVEDIINEIRR